VKVIGEEKKEFKRCHQSKRLLSELPQEREKNISKTPTLESPYFISVPKEYTDYSSHTTTYAHPETNESKCPASFLRWEYINDDGVNNRGYCSESDTREASQDI
jgi:hypothetical protein